MHPHKSNPTVKSLRDRAARNYRQARIVKHDYPAQPEWASWWRGLALGYKESANELAWAISYGHLTEEADDPYEYDAVHGRGKNI